VHTNATFCPWAISYTVSRELVRHQTLRGRKKIPFSVGGNYVDVDLGIIVRSAPGTLMAFKPQYRHGTTLSYGAMNMGYAVTFSRRVIDAYHDLSQEEKAHFFIRPVDGDYV
jgi:hypothetical protein